jgi:hypothetical protein
MSQAIAWAYLDCQQWNFSFRRLCLDIFTTWSPLISRPRMSIHCIHCLNQSSTSTILLAQYWNSSAPTDQAALYQEIQAQRRLGNKEAIQALVRRLEELKQQQQVAQAQYLLEDANTTRSSP